MSNKTIAKFAGVVIFVVGALFVMSCSHASSTGRSTVNSAELSQDYDKPINVGRIESAEITESSGLAASLCQQDVYWTHNDSGNGAFIFAMNSTGKHLGTWQVGNARNADWEDLAAFKQSDGTCYLYIGDIGDNEYERTTLTVYRVAEPLISSEGGASSKKKPLQTAAAEMLVFKYPDTAHNAETLVVHPQTGIPYVLTKRIDGPSRVYKIQPQFGSPTTIEAERVGDLAIPAIPNGFLTGGSISPDGDRVVVCDYSAGYELKLGVGTNFDDIWKSKPNPVDLGDRKQGEAVAFSADGRSLYATSEKKNSPIIKIKLK